MEQQNNTENPDAKSFKMYKGKAPLLLQIVGGLMWLGGLGMILQGIPMLLFLGIGVIPIAFGCLNIKYARKIFKMEKKGYTGALVLQGVTALLAIILWGMSGFASFNQTAVSVLLFAAIVSGVLYMYREQFTN